MKTENLIDQLTQEMAGKTSKRPSSLKILSLWFVASLFSVIVGLRLLGNDHDLLSRISDPKFLTEVFLGLTVVVLAAGSAVIMGTPGHKEKVKFLPIATVLLWVGVVLYGVFPGVVEVPEKGWGYFFTNACFNSVMMLSVVPGIILFFMIRRLAPTHLGWTGAMATLAGASLASIVVHAGCLATDSVHVLLSHIIPAIVIMGIGIVAGKLALRW